MPVHRPPTDGVPPKGSRHCYVFSCVVLWFEKLYELVETLALTLLVTRVLADDHHVAVTADDLALVTDLLDAGLDLHGGSLTGIGRPVRRHRKAAHHLERGEPRWV